VQPFTSPSPSDRLLSTAGYFGLDPLVKFWRSRSPNPFLQHHHAQAMSALFCVLLLFLAACLFDTAECIVFVQFPHFAQQLIDRWGWLLVYLDYAMWLPMLAIVALWVTLLGLAVAGSSWQVPLLKRLLQKPWVTRVSFVANSIFLALIPLIAVLAFHATSLTRRNSDNAAVYFLYDGGVWVPRWGFGLGLYRVSLQAQKKWGRGCTVLDHLNKETLRTALANGKVVILATHGADGYATTSFAHEILSVWPADTGATDGTNSSRFLRASVRGPDHKWGKDENVPVGGHLQLAYIFACNGGTKASQWAEHLAPAQVITYNRVSTVWDHAVWFALTGPGQMKKLQ
jgi:hypothetical protein